MEDINAWQFGLVIVAGYLGAGIFQFPRELVDFAGPDALWAYLLLAAFFLGLFWLYLNVAEINPDRSFGSVLQSLLTPFVGWPIQAVRIGIHWILAMFVLANFGQVMHTFFLPSTPAWAVESALAGTAMYMVWFGTATFARTLETILLPTALGSILIGLLVAPRMREIWAVLPVGHLAVRPILAGAYHSAYIFVGFETLGQVYGHVRVDARKAAKRNAYIVFAVSVFLYGYGYAVTIGTEGPSALSRMQWPPVSALRLANLHGFFISKLGLLVVVLWGLLALAFVGARYWCVAQNLAENPDRELKVGRYHLMLVLAGATSGVGAQPLGNVNRLVHIFQTMGLPFMMVYLIVVPVTILSVHYLTRWRRSQKAQSSG